MPGKGMNVYRRREPGRDCERRRGSQRVCERDSINLSPVMILEGEMSHRNIKIPTSPSFVIVNETRRR
jgi:hypothetical protein